MVLGLALAWAAARLARRVPSRILGLLGTVWTLHAVLVRAAWLALRGRYEVRWKT